MESIPKSSQELAAQMMDALPYYSDYGLPEGEAARLEEQANQMRAGIKDSIPYMRTDEELDTQLAAVKQRAEDSGVWRADQGSGAQERLVYATEKNKGFGFSQEDAASDAHKQLRNTGYLNAIKAERREQERTFTYPVAAYINGHELPSAIEKTEVDKMLKNTIDIATITESETGRMRHDFPSGNFLYHGTNTERVIKIIDSGTLSNAQALREREQMSAVIENREPEIVPHNSGNEGVSWSMNVIDALPGDRYHLAGFIAAPEAVLQSDQQLVVPSRPAPNEVLQISAEVDANEYYDAKTQLELYRSSNPFGESNSVFDNLFAAGNFDLENEKSGFEPQLHQALGGTLAETDYQERLRRLYGVNGDGKIELSPDLLQQTGETIPVAAVWLQAALDTARLAGTEFAGKDVRAVINSLNKDNCRDLVALSRQDWESADTLADKAEAVSRTVDVPVASMYLVAARKDADMWLKIVARSPHKPAGMVLYDDKKVRLENFASLHRGDHAELTKELQTAILPENQDYIPYESVLGRKFTDSMRAGSKHQAIAEKYLSKCRTIKKVGRRLSVGDTDGDTL